MQRITITRDDKLAEELERFGYGKAAATGPRRSGTWLFT